MAAYLSGDNRRLVELLRRATAGDGPIDLALYQEFRAGLLRHIGMEEKLLIPVARRVVPDSRLDELARQIRLDHGAIAAMLVPTPTRELVARLLSVLGPHNELEEDPDGLYAICERVLVPRAEELVAELRAFPAPPLAPHRDTPLVARHIEETLALAGR
jgi:hypothetical protein